MRIPQHLLDAVAHHRAVGRRAGLLVRHAERHHVRDLATHEMVLLTERGHEQARASGVALARQAARIAVMHSPVERCAETARGLVEGASSTGAAAELVCAVPALYAPFIRDRERAWKIVMTTGPTFIRDWFDGKLPPDVFQPRTEATQGQLDAMAQQLDTVHADALAVFVSHDWNIALIREDVLGFTPERAWPDFLDGVVVAIDGDDVVIEMDGRVGRRPRGGRDA